MTRKLASVRTISMIEPIEGADAIELAHVDGWKVVVKKGEYQQGDAAVYLEIDSWVPEELAPFLVKGAIAQEFNGVKGARLRTIKLRGQISQGLLLPLYDYPPTDKVMTAFHKTRPAGFEPMDVTGLLGIQKYEKPLPAQLSGRSKETSRPGSARLMKNESRTA